MTIPSLHKIIILDDKCNGGAIGVPPARKHDGTCRNNPCSHRARSGRCVRRPPRKNDDGSSSLITIDPTIDGFNFVVGGR
jgi:hypothetical protein